MPSRVPSAALAGLAPGQAIHFGHSFLVVNIAGLRFALDPATETGYLAAPFSNLTATAATPLRSYQPLVDPAGLLPSAEALAEHVDVVLYSHLHADHFNAALLARMLRAQPGLQALWPAGAPQLLRPPRRPLAGWGQSAAAALNRLPWADNVPAGLQEYLASAPLELPAGRTHEVDDGWVRILRARPLVGVRAFAVRHPRPLLWVRTPWEAAVPPVLGYEIFYEEGETLRSVLLVGESSTDPEVLYQIWASRERLVSVFAPADQMPGLPGVSWLYDSYFHASPRLLALAEKLVGPRTSLHGLHHGLWLYTLTEGDLERERRRLAWPRAARGPAAGLPEALRASRAARELSWQAVGRFQALLARLRQAGLEAGGHVTFTAMGQAFALGG
ncbi:MAG: hypothetical protein JNK29_00730 [Anaerolineales bacterium]|nr:hypothetical protein [Anaerolineales bacterium]